MGYTLLLAEGCNLQCKYCYEGERKKAKLLSSEVAEKTLKYICDIAGDKECIDLMLLGGEPLLNKPGFFKILDLINNEYKNKKFNIEMTTNGTFLDQDILNVIFESEIDLSISLDGKKNINDLNRISKSSVEYYDKVLDCIKQLIKEKKRFNIRMTVTPNNVRYLMENVKYFYDIGVNRIYIGLDEFTYWSDKDLFILDSQMYELDKFYLKNIVNYKNKVLNLYDFNMSIFIAKRDVTYCSAGSNNHLVIDCDGNIYPCNYVTGKSEWIIGNIGTSVKKSTFVEMVKKSLIHDNQVCQECDAFFFCHGKKCGFKNYSLTGYLDKIHDSTCQLEKILFKHNKEVFSIMFKRNYSRFIDMYNYCKKHKIEFTDFILNLEGRKYDF